LRTLYLHIGSSKTGTSTLQRFLFTNRDVLLTKGFYYPCEGEYFYPPESSQSLLAHALAGQRPAYIRKATVFRKANCVADITRDIQKYPTKNVIISSEHFLRFAGDENRELYDMLAPHFEKIVVISYCRRQDLHLESAFNQNTKTGENDSPFAVYYQESLKNYLTGRFNYLQILEAFGENFGRSNLVVRPYEKGQLLNGSVVDDFASQIGCPVDEQFSPPEQRNRSLPTELIVLIRTLNQGLPQEVRQAVARRMRKLPIKFDQKKYTLYSPEQRQQIIDLCTPINQKIAKEYLHRADGKLFYDDVKVDLPRYPGLSKNLLVQTIKALLFTR